MTDYKQGKIAFSFPVVYSCCCHNIVLHSSVSAYPKQSINQPIKHRCSESQYRVIRST